LLLLLSIDLSSSTGLGTGFIISCIGYSTSLTSCSLETAGGSIFSDICDEFEVVLAMV